MIHAQVEAIFAKDRRSILASIERARLVMIDVAALKHEEELAAFERDRNVGKAEKANEANSHLAMNLQIQASPGNWI